MREEKDEIITWSRMFKSPGGPHFLSCVKLHVFAFVFALHCHRPLAATASSELLLTRALKPT